MQTALINSIEASAARFFASCTEDNKFTPQFQFALVSQVFSGLPLGQLRVFLVLPTLLLDLDHRFVEKCFQLDNFFNMFSHEKDINPAGTFNHLQRHDSFPFVTR